MMTILLDLSFLVASIAVLAVTFATHNAHRTYLVALYVLATVFFSCFVLSLFDSLILTVSSTLIALGVAGAAGVATYFRSRSWVVGDQKAFLLRFSVVIPSVLFVAVVALRILLQREKDTLADQKAQQATESANAYADSLRREWQKRKPKAVPGLIIALLLSFSTMAQIPFSIRAISPDCCLQADTLQAKLTVATDSIRTLNRTIVENYELGDANISQERSAKEAAQGREASALVKLATVETKLVTLEQASKKYVPRTWLARQWIGLKNGLAYIGATTVVTGIYLIVR